MTAGQMLAHYRILERIGAGGMGEVYKALDTHLNRTVAIKVLPVSAVADAGRRQRFIQEAHAASALDHPNIVAVYDISEADGQLFIVMQYVAGKTLRALFGSHGLPLNDALRYAFQMADALAQAHARGIVHRDLKPENVMVTEQGQVKILDFGLAKLIEPVEANETSEETGWSAGGRWIYFGSNRGGDWQVWKVPAEGGAAVQVTRHGGREAFESVDGKILYYTKQTPAAGIWRVAPGGGEETQAIDRGAQGGWAITPEGIGFVSSPDSAPAIQFYRFSTGAITQIAALPKGVRIFASTNHLAISRDLRWILYNQIDRVESDIILVENFR
ncbi:MAG: serine/threonine-protein kinase [Acidobacteria bacterium]|nr:serine/threonine-protein kinase [Acidobacteriota bacterium]